MYVLTLRDVTTSGVAIEYKKKRVVIIVREKKRPKGEEIWGKKSMARILVRVSRNPESLECRNWR